MEGYKQPRTRIKRVRDSKGERFYPQYKQVIIPFLWEEWQPTYTSIEEKEYTIYLETAKQRIDNWLMQDYDYYVSELNKSSKPKVKKEVEYIDYP